jgi:hypothetical protein
MAGNPKLTVLQADVAPLVIQAFSEVFDSVKRRVVKCHADRQISDMVMLSGPLYRSPANLSFGDQGYDQVAKNELA